jgi:hypothetical protein
MSIRSRLVVTAVLLVACGAPAAAPDAATLDARINDTGGSIVDAARDDAGPSTLRRCPPETGDACFLLTPIETGLPTTGAGADEDQVALRPLSGARGQLLLFFNGSGGSPTGGAATPETSWYTVARDAGLHVLGVSYRSADAIGLLCRGDDTCFLPTRESILDGAFHTGAATALETITADEGIYARVRAALVLLARDDPDGGWNAFFDASETDAARSIRWELVLASGHSQGGGHAALLGRRHALARVVMLSSPCDAVVSAPASWLAGPGGYATDTTTRFFGLGSPGDTICPEHVAIWGSLGMPAAAQDDGAVACAGSTSPHGNSIRCVENAAAWQRLLAP